MDWKSFAKGVAAVLVVAIVVVLAILGYRAYNERNDKHYCETAIARVENYPLSHLGELEVEVCVKVDIEIPERLLRP